MREYPIEDVSKQTSNKVNTRRIAKAHGVLVHMTAGTNSLAWLQGLSGEASADYLIRRDGHIYDITPKGRVANHAGFGEVTLPDGRKYTNRDVSEVLIGIELEATINQSPTWHQYAACAYLIVTRLAPEWGWGFPYVIFGHYATARPFGRRSDPWNFNYGAFLGATYSYAHERGII